MGELEAANDISVDFNIQIESDGLGCELVELGITRKAFPVKSYCTQTHNQTKRRVNQA